MFEVTLVRFDYIVSKFGWGTVFQTKLGKINGEKACVNLLNLLLPGSPKELIKIS